MVSRTRFPPAPNALKQINKPRVTQEGAAPATIVNTDEKSREKLNANRRPIISAEKPQKIAPTNMPT